MTTAIGPTILRMAGAISREIRETARRLTPPQYRELSRVLETPIFPVEGPRDSWYEATPFFRLKEHLDKLNLPSNYHSADLGSGLGSACYAMAVHFESVTGFELHPILFNEAERICRQFNITGVEFRNQDFMNVSLDRFQVIYFFRPMSEPDSFVEIMEKLRETRPGTYIISRSFMNCGLYDPCNFTYLAPLDDYIPGNHSPRLIFTRL